MRLLLLATLLYSLSAGSLNAQSYATDKGVWLLGGTGRISSVRSGVSNTRSFGLSINPRVGLFVTRGLAASLTGLLGYTAGSGTSWQYGIGPGITYYVGKGDSRLYPFLSFRTIAVRTTSHFESPTGQVFNSATNEFVWLGSAGVLLMLARNVGLTGEFFYTHATFSSPSSIGTSSSDEYGVSLGVAAFVF